MSIILKGIDLPKKGKTIRLEIEDDGTVWEVGYDVMGRLQDVEAIQIPKGHGRLTIDLWDGRTEQGSFEMLIDDAPTILESEE